MTVSHPLLSAAGSRAGLWLLHSGIQHADGGVARYYRSDTKRNNPISTEITGYAVSAFSYLFEKTGEAEYSESALRAAHFLSRRAWLQELCAFPFEYRPEESELSPAYFFDTGIIVRGLLSAWRLSGDRGFLDLAATATRAMWRDFDAGEDFHPVLELPSKRPAARDARWSRSSGCYQLKAALGWRELADVTGDEEFARRYEGILNSALSTHATFLPGSGDENLVMDRLHAYCYCLEAFLADGIDVSEGVARAAYHLGKIAPRFARSDVYAQLLRIRLMSGTALEAAPAEARELETFQVRGEDPAMDGGFYFGRKNGTFLPFVNPVSTAFALQALQMWREHEAGSLDRDYRTLI